MPHSRPPDSRVRWYSLRSQPSPGLMRRTGSRQFLHFTRPSPATDYGGGPPMAMFDSAISTSLLALLLNDTAFSAVPATNILLGTNTPSAGTDMTQLSGSGYTTGGSSITWNAVSAGATSNSGTISWTNTGGSGWSLVGLEIWNSAASTRYLWGTWTGEPVTVAIGDTFEVAPAAIAVSLV